MTIKSTYSLTYVVDKEQKELTVIVELFMRDGVKQPFKNLYVGSAYVNGQSYEDDLLESCVDAKSGAERIGLKEKDKMLARYKKEGKKVRIKNEIIK